MAKPFGMYSYSNKILKNLPAPPRSPIRVEVKADERGILVIAEGDSLWNGFSIAQGRMVKDRWVKRGWSGYWEYRWQTDGYSKEYTSARRNVYEKEIRQIFNDYTTPAENLNGKYNEEYQKFREHGIIE